jgi:ribosomal-protein-alanine N-acetyltransferase
VSGPRVRIIHLAPAALVALAAGDLEAASASSPVPLTPWLVSEEAIGTWRYRATQVAGTPADLDWVTGLIWDEERAVVVGKAGFHGAPDADGMVEVGYAVDPAERRRGYARAALLAMLDRARAEPSVRTFRATVSPSNIASLGLIAQLPFVEVGEQWDDEDGLETIYELSV